MNRRIMEKRNIVRKIVTALVIVGMLVNVEGVQGIGTLTVRAAVSFPDWVDEGDIYISYEDTGKCEGYLAVFCESVEDAQNALDSLYNSSDSAAISSQINDLDRYGKVVNQEMAGTEADPFRWCISVPYTINNGSGSYSVDAWVLRGSKTVTNIESLHYTGVAVYYAFEKPTYNIYCAYGDDATKILDEYFSSGNDNFLSSFGSGNVIVSETEPSKITDDGYDVKSWKKKGEDSAASSNIAVYQAVYEGGYECIPGEDVDAEDYKKTKEFSFDNSSSEASIALPTAEDTGFCRTGYSLAGWSEEPGMDDYLEPGDDHELYPGVIRDYYAVWTPKTEVTLKVTVAEPVYDNDDIASKISVQKTPAEATGTPALEYKVKGADDSTYSDNVPTSAGEYTVRATLDESEDYALAEGTADFEVLSSTLDVSIQYKPGDGTGDTVKKSVTAELSDDHSKAQVTLLDKADFKRTGYKLVGWKEGKNTYDLGGVYSFSVDEDATTASLTFTAVWERVPEVEVSVEYSPNGGTGDKVKKTETVKLSDDYKTGKITLLDKADFKREGYTLVGWSDGKKTYDLGSVYTFSVASDETSKSLAFDAVWSGKEKGSVEIKLKKSTCYVGTKIEYEIEKNSDGDVTVEYKKTGEGDSKYSTDTPKEPGRYTVRATLKETDDHTADEDKEDLEIVYLDTPKDPYTYQVEKDSAGNVTDVKVKPKDGFEISLTQSGFVSSVSYSDARAGGIYLRQESDSAITDKITVAPYYIEDKPELKVDGAVDGKVLYGTKYNVSYSSASPAAKKVLYKDKNAKVESAYSETAPTKPGDYTVMLSAEASGFYAPVSITEDFSIVYLKEKPKDDVSLDGKGANGWFRTDVQIKAPKDYQISTTGELGSFTDSITWNKSIEYLYYRREDGAITEPIKFDQEVNIDKVTPVAVFPDGLEVDDKKKTITVFMDKLTFTIKEDNLKELKIGKDKIDVNSGKNGVYEISLEAGEEAEDIKISAEDLAGNKYEFTLNLVPSWGADGIMPADRFVKLKSGITYKLKKESQWTVEVDNKKDNTVYSGGSEFYVKEDGVRCRFSENSKKK